ncbi:hypothetical protein AGABI1DRAFT_125354 [Agaricus bisporus var. burnettii JB137-S8]|uniref:PNK3P-domain-containing protein n=1 Tax=Agaricus bisporus var. burnettii (strain JB137-S8 / ATCC MYA-4627 / FGSC 10392) TaxID=597362 RepID=K5XHF4_AGABU|nr:uncharacterized protein AGABI1DRAFT_125354 [Agaricus bisporus var. burnettii JB137-S8]EKM82888.1 hypothetical protein AGABI1DRAFT_125354 [Agaricus bisporus var. burnettii JB137-S8]
MSKYSSHVNIWRLASWASSAQLALSPFKVQMPDNSSKKSKRPAEEPHTEEPPPKKIHPFFSKESAKANEACGPFKWLPPLGKKKTCLHGLNLKPELHCKIAAFDLDGTVIKFANYDNNEWQWWNSIVPTRLHEVARQGYTIVFFSNQAIKPLALKKWKEKIITIASALDDVPFRVYAATAKDGYRKPMLGMWWELEKVFKEENCEIDLTHSFFVGDAAGRQYKGRKSDFASTDRKFALNIGISFMTPEEYFLNLPTHSSYQLPGFNVSSLPERKYSTLMLSSSNFDKTL